MLLIKNFYIIKFLYLKLHHKNGEVFFIYEIQIVYNPFTFFISKPGINAKANKANA